MMFGYGYGFQDFVDNLEKMGKKLIIPQFFEKPKISSEKKKVNIISVLKTRLLNKSLFFNVVAKILGILSKI